MNYRVLLVPIDDSSLTGRVVDVDGKTYQTRELGSGLTIVKGNQVKDFVESIAYENSFGAAALYMVSGGPLAYTNPSGTQLTGLIGYATLIRNSINTATVETAITALLP